MLNKEIYVVDFGSPSTPLINQLLKKLHVESKLFNPYNFKYNPEATGGIILSGSPNSVEQTHLYTNFLNDLVEINQQKIPILGICFGHQILAEYLGGKVLLNYNKEHGEYEITINDSSKFTCQANGLKLDIGEKINVWMDHNDSVALLPEGFKEIAHSDNFKYSIMADDEREIYGVQFHPEIDISGNGESLINNFINIVQGDYILGDCTINDKNLP